MKTTLLIKTPTGLTTVTANGTCSEAIKAAREQHGENIKLLSGRTTRV